MNKYEMLVEQINLAVSKCVHIYGCLDVDIYIGTDEFSFLLDCYRYSNQRFHFNIDYSQDIPITFNGFKVMVVTKSNFLRVYPNLGE